MKNSLSPRVSRPLRLCALFAAALVALVAVPIAAGAAVGDLEEIGANDFRVSITGDNADASRRATDAVVAHNSKDDEYLAVWTSDDPALGLKDDELEVFGQRMDGDGSLIGSEFRISDMGGTDNAAFDAIEPAVAYNSTANTYLVVWHGDDNLGGYANDKFEIHARFVKADGTFDGNGFRISEMGPANNPNFGAFDADVAYDSENDQFLIVWTGDAPEPGNNEEEVWGQRLSGDGQFLDSRIRLSDMGPEDQTLYDAESARVAWSSTSPYHFLVVWAGDNHDQGQSEDEYEIFGQRVTPGGDQALPNDFRISSTGTLGNPLGDDEYDATDPSVAYNASSEEWGVAWVSDHQLAGIDNDEFEVYWQRVRTNGSLLLGNSRISSMGGFGDDAYDAADPEIVANPTRDEYAVVWQGNDDADDLHPSEFEIYGQRLTGFGAEIGVDDARLTNVGGIG